MEWSIDEDEKITRSQDLRRPGTEASPERRITGVGGLGVMSGDVGWLMDGLLWHSSSFVGRGTARAPSGAGASTGILLPSARHLPSPAPPRSFLHPFSFFRLWQALLALSVLAARLLYDIALFQDL